MKTLKDINQAILDILQVSEVDVDFQVTWGSTCGPERAYDVVADAVNRALDRIRYSKETKEH